MRASPARPSADLPLICHILFKLDFGGLENGVVNLINWMPRDAYRHAILCVSHATEFRRRINRNDVDIFEAHKGLGKDLGAYRRVWQILRRLKPTIVHTRNLPALDMLFVARLAGVRHLIHSEHGLDISELDGKNHKYNRLRRLTSPFVGRYISVSADLKRWLVDIVGLDTNCVALVYNGVDTARFSPGSGLRKRHDGMPFAETAESAVPFFIGTVGRFAPVKDQVTLVQAFVQLTSRQPDLRSRLRLVLVGDGDMRSEIEATLTEGGVADLAWMPGFREDVAELYQGFDIFVLPSRREGISNTALEAMASGLPVVATAVGGNQEIILDGETGFLVPPADPDAMANAIARYVNDPSLLRKHSEAARRHTELHFSPEAMVAGYRKVYDALLAS